MVDGLVFPRPLQQELLAYAEAGRPAEVCGILAGRDNVISHVFPVDNTADSVHADSGVFRDRDTGAPSDGRVAVHYYMDPRDQLRVYRTLDDLELDVIAYYHSHTFTEARPSPTDVRLAADLLPHYVLVSLTHTPNVRAWRIAKADPGDETGQVIEVPLLETP